MASFVDAAAAGSSSEEEVARSSSEEEVARSSSEEEEAGFLDDSALAVTPSAHRRLDWARTVSTCAVLPHHITVSCVWWH